jgi:hypothetical protein
VIREPLGEADNETNISIVFRNAARMWHPCDGRSGTDAATVLFDYIDRCKDRHRIGQNKHDWRDFSVQGQRRKTAHNSARRSERVRESRSQANLVGRQVGRWRNCEHSTSAKKIARFVFCLPQPFVWLRASGKFKHVLWIIFIRLPG